MKKLKKLSLNKEEIVNLNDLEMRNVKGGSDMTMEWNSEFNCYMLSEVTVYAERYTRGEITLDEFQDILTVAVAAGTLGSNFGLYGTIAGFVIGGVVATGASLYY